MDVSRVANSVAFPRMASGLTFIHEQVGGGGINFQVTTRDASFQEFPALFLPPSSRRPPTEANSRSSLFASSGRGSPRTFPSVRASTIQRLRLGLVIRLSSSIFSSSFFFFFSFPMLFPSQLSSVFHRGTRRMDEDRSSKSLLLLPLLLLISARRKSRGDLLQPRS